MRTITHLVVHHTATAGERTTWRGVDNVHRTRNWGTVAQPIYARQSRLGYFVQYHYFIDWKGNLTQTRSDSEIGWHANRANPFSLGVCLAGWFDPGRDRAPSPAEVKTLAELLQRLRTRYQILLKNIVPHRRFNPHKSCYGGNLPDDWARKLAS